MSGERPLRVRVGIPHFFQEQPGEGPYGSSRHGARGARALALGRCLSALLDLQRGSRDLRLHISGRRIEHLPAQRPAGAVLERPLTVEIQVCTDGEHQLDEVLEAFAGRITVHHLAVDDPRALALRTRDRLIQEGEIADLTLYLEDDLVIADPLFLDKQAWFLAQTGGRMVLMPHRYERVDRGGAGVMLIDGPLREDVIARFCTPTADRVIGSFGSGPAIHFEVPANPHAGCFCLSRPQVERLRGLPLAQEGFVGPLETAATLTVLQHLEVLKPSLPHWRFLSVEHAHAAFLGYIDRFPIGPLTLTPSPPASDATP
ncbi:MAG: hypothetical protein VKK43_00875 [Synechococcaceae cyanobacterium]|nr:hypothetical protein [Synechococcaceae cyanobacterium]